MSNLLFPTRLPNGLKRVDGTAPRYVRDTVVHPTAARLRMEPDLLTDINDAAVGMWRVSEKFDRLSAEMLHSAREASFAIVDGLISACSFDALVTALNSERANTETNLTQEQVQDVAREVSGLKLELRRHVAAIFDSTIESVELVTPEAIAKAAAELHVGIAALVFSEAENSKHAPDSPRRNRGKALLARLHSCQATFERGTPSATTAAPSPYAARVLAAFRDVAAGVASLSVPSTVDAVAAEATVGWMQLLVGRLEAIGQQVRRLGGSWRRLNLVWSAELRSPPVTDAAGASRTLAEAKDPFGVRSAFQQVADASLAAVPQAFDFSCDEARRACDVTLPQLAKAASLRNDCAFKCLSHSAAVLSQTRDRLLPLWAHIAEAGPATLTTAATGVVKAQINAAQARRWAVAAVATAHSLLRDPTDMEKRDLAKRLESEAFHLKAAALRGVCDDINKPLETRDTNDLAAAANALAAWGHAHQSDIAVANDPSTANGSVRPAIAVIQDFVDSHAVVEHVVESLGSAILSQCVLDGVARFEKTTPAQRETAVQRAIAEAPCGFADAVVERLVAMTSNHAVEYTIPSETARWLPLARAWARFTASLPAVEPHVAWDVGAVGARMSLDVTPTLTMDQQAEAEAIDPFAALDYAAAQWDVVGTMPAVRDAISVAVLHVITEYNSVQHGWSVLDRRAAAAADVNGSWRFQIIVAAIRRLGVKTIPAAGEEPAKTIVHPVVASLDDFCARIAVMGLNALNLCDSCPQSILSDTASFSAATAKALHERDDAGNWLCPQCSWWRQQ